MCIALSIITTTILNEKLANCYLNPKDLLSYITVLSLIILKELMICC